MGRSVGVVAAGVAVLTLTAGCSALTAVGPRSAPTPPPSSLASSAASPRPSASEKSPTPSSAPSAADSGDWSSVLEEVRGGVVRLQVAGCQEDAAWMGSGFVVGPHLVMTAAHVARGARTISVKSDEAITSAEVIDYDLAADVALLRTRSTFAEQALDLDVAEPKLGSDLAELGYPLSVNHLRVSTGIVSGSGDSVTYPDTETEEGFTVEHTFVTDAATNGGNSGGPVVDTDGEVIGLVSGGQDWDAGGRPVQGTNFVVPAADLQSRFQRWADDRAQPAGDCDGDAAAPVADAVLEVDVSSGHEDAADIAQALFLHGEGINSGNYEGAWSVFTPAQQARMGDVETWQQGLSSSYWRRVDIIRVSRDGARARAVTELRTEQDPEDGGGQDCSDYDMTFELRLRQGSWLIDREIVPRRPSPC